MNQKDQIKNYFNTVSEIPFYIKIVGICAWLEDINWHTECSMLYDTLKENEQKRTDLLQTVDYLDRTGNYSKDYVLNMIEKLGFEKNQLIRKFLNEKEAYYLKIDTTVITKDELMHFQYAQDFYKVFSKLWGFGLDKSWANNSGERFVNEILEVIK